MRWRVDARVRRAGLSMRFRSDMRLTRVGLVHAMDIHAMHGYQWKQLTFVDTIIFFGYPDSEIVMVDGTFWDDSFEQHRSWGDTMMLISDGVQKLFKWSFCRC